MTKKHFRALAREFYLCNPSEQVAGEKQLEASEMWETMICVVADVCAQANPNFNREKFLTACREGL